MHANTFDRYQHRVSAIHRIDPRLKVMGTILIIFSNAFLPDGAWAGFLASLTAVWLINRLAQLSWKGLLVRSVIVIPFLLAAITVPFTMQGEPLFTLAFGDSLLSISVPGTIRFFSILLRSWISVQAALILTSVTTFPDIVHALRHLRVPSILVAIISFMYRYLFVLTDETLRLLRAREARSARLSGEKSGGSLIWRARIAGSMAGQLFLRSYERSERVYNAMLARGYRGNLLTINPHSMNSVDWSIFGLLLILIAALQIFVRVF